MAITTSILSGAAFAASIAVSWDHDRRRLADDIRIELANVPTQLDGTQRVQIWLEDVRDGDDALLAPLAHSYRDVLQLRRPLPAPASGLETRAFDFDTDADEFITVNNRAFSWHPEQSGLTRERLCDTMEEPWFDANGFRILEIEGRMAGFCWTKVHNEHSPVIGEIYVIAIDPDFHGQGLGGPMTLAGLEWLAGRHISMSNLYVESDNHPAVRTYERLGFVLYGTNRAYSTHPVPDATDV